MLLNCWLLLHLPIGDAKRRENQNLFFVLKIKKSIVTSWCNATHAFIYYLSRKSIQVVLYISYDFPVWYTWFFSEFGNCYWILMVILKLFLFPLFPHLTAEPGATKICSFVDSCHLSEENFGASKLPLALTNCFSKLASFLNDYFLPLPWSWPQPICKIVAVSYTKSARNSWGIYLKDSHRKKVPF